MSSKQSSRQEELKHGKSVQDKKNLDQLADSFQISDYMDEAPSKDQTINDLLEQNNSPPRKKKA